MNRFFVSDEVYEDRIAICKECIYYFKPTGTCKRCLCFMKVKARLAPMACPQKYWDKTTEVETPDDLPQEIIDETYKITEKPIYNTNLFKEKTKDNLIQGEHIDWISINEV